MRHGLKLIAAVLLPFALAAAFLLLVVLPRAVVKVHGGPNRLRLVVLDKAGIPVTNATVQFTLQQEVPLIPLPFAPTRFVRDARAVISDGKGRAEVSWPNMSLTARSVLVEGVLYPVEGGGWKGSIVGPTPDGRSTWDVSTNYAARVVIDRLAHSATVYAADNAR